MISWDPPLYETRRWGQNMLKRKNITYPTYPLAIENP